MRIPARISIAACRRRIDALFYWRRARPAGPQGGFCGNQDTLRAANLRRKCAACIDAATEKMMNFDRRRDATGNVLEAGHENGSANTWWLTAMRDRRA